MIAVHFNPPLVLLILLFSPSIGFSDFGLWVFFIALFKIGCLTSSLKLTHISFNTTYRTTANPPSVPSIPSCKVTTVATVNALDNFSFLQRPEWPPLPPSLIQTPPNVTVAWESDCPEKSSVPSSLAAPQKSCRPWTRRGNVTRCRCLRAKKKKISGGGRRQRERMWRWNSFSPPWAEKVSGHE